MLKTTSVVQMRASVEVSVGDRVLYPYSSAVAAGEPSRVKVFHSKYHDQEGVIVEIKEAPGNLFVSDEGSLFFKVRFSDGHEQDNMAPDFLIYIGPPSGPPVTNKTKTK